MPFQAKIDHVRLAKCFMPSSEIYAASVPYLKRMTARYPNESTAVRERLLAVRDANEAIRTGQFPALPTTPVMGNHYHGPLSWGKEGFRIFSSAAALISKLNNEIVSGQIEHYMIDPSREFAKACAILGLPYTTGYEIRALVRNPLDVGGYDLSQIIINSPGKIAEAYIVFHCAANSRSPFLRQAGPAKLERYAQVTDIINGALRSRQIRPLSFSVIKADSSYNNVLDKHVIGALFDGLYDHFNGAQRFDSAVDKMVALMDELKNSTVSRAKLEKARATYEGYERDYAVFTAVVDMMRDALLSTGALAFVTPSELECPSFERLSAIAAEDNAILAYPILLKSAGGNEDPYLKPLLSLLFNRLGFHAISWMPNRNTPAESGMIKAITAAIEKLSISGMDVNKFLQRWVEEASADPWLIETTFALVGHEVAVRNGLLGIPDQHTLPYPQNIHFFAELGRKYALFQGDVSGLDYGRIRERFASE